MTTIFDIATPTIAIEGTQARFPVRRIFCVGQNYADHAREMGADPDRAPPFFFTKPADAVVEHGAMLPFPSRTASLHHEVELVIALGSGGADLAPQAATDAIYGWTVGIDLTRRDLQAEAKKAAARGTWPRASTSPRPSAPCDAAHRRAPVPSASA